MECMNLLRTETHCLLFTLRKKMGENMTRIPKGVFTKASHNPNARAAQKYSVVENLAQTPCAMSSLEVLKVSLLREKRYYTS